MVVAEGRRDGIPIQRLTAQAGREADFDPDSQGGGPRGGPCPRLAAAANRARWAEIQFQFEPSRPRGSKRGTGTPEGGNDSGPPKSQGPTTSTSKEAAPPHSQTIRRTTDWEVTAPETLPHELGRLGSPKPCGGVGPGLYAAQPAPICWDPYELRSSVESRRRKRILFR